ncbi:Rv3235 family protein [Streptomyces sp. NPDC048659]|uniref:Rv3235 family protein n=1 Tax=Streptomyces sp. NPDC048659 TaxID=3155489 RepID=UPI00343116EF
MRTATKATAKTATTTQAHQRTRPAGPGGATRPSGPAGTGPRGRAGTGPLRTPPPHVLFAERLLAVLSGERPVHWMLGHTVGEGYEQLVRLAPGTPLRSHGPRPVLRHCSARPPGPDAVEACATIATGPRVRALAFRLERGRDRRWRCAAVEVDGLPGQERGQGPGPGHAGGAGHRIR